MSTTVEYSALLEHNFEEAEAEDTLESYDSDMEFTGPVEFEVEEIDYLPPCGEPEPQFKIELGETQLQEYFEEPQSEHSNYIGYKVKCENVDKSSSTNKVATSIENSLNAQDISDILNQFELYNPFINNTITMTSNKDVSDSEAPNEQIWQCKSCKQVHFSVPECIQHKAKCNQRLPDVCVAHVRKDMRKVNLTRFQCQTCSAPFSTKVNCQMHIENMHSKKTSNNIVKRSIELYYCYTCLRLFDETKLKTNVQLDTNIEKSAGNSNNLSTAVTYLTCPLCNRSFKDIGEVRVHLTKEHYTSVNTGPTERRKRKIRCDICPMLFGRVQDLYRHVTSTHNIDISFLAYKKHWRIVNGPRKVNIRQHHCLVCAAKCCTMESTSADNNKETAAQSVQYQCMICKDVFAYVGVIASHMINVHCLGPNEEQPLQCVVCHILFEDINSAQSHMFRVHCSNSTEYVNKKQYQCETCSALFVSKRSLKTHMINIHSNDNNKNFVSTIKFKCLLCEDMFLKVASLQLHLREQHEEILKTQDNLEAGESECPVCGRVSEEKCPCTQDDVKREKIHTLAHSIVSHFSRDQLTTFKCPVCRHTFRGETNIHDHMTNHFSNVQHIEVELTKGSKFVRYKCRGCNGVVFSLQQCWKHYLECSNVGNYLSPIVPKTGSPLPSSQQAKPKSPSKSQTRQKSSDIPSASPSAPVQNIPEIISTSSAAADSSATIVSTLTRFVCPICSRYYKSKKNIKIHFQWSHPDLLIPKYIKTEKLPVYKCTSCDKLCMSRLSYEKHISSCRDVEKSDTIVQRYFCPQCKHHYPSIELCKEHIKLQHPLHMDVLIHEIVATDFDAKFASMRFDNRLLLRSGDEDSEVEDIDVVSPDDQASSETVQVSHQEISSPEDPKLSQTPVVLVKRLTFTTEQFSKSISLKDFLY